MARLRKVLEELLVEAGALKPIEMGPHPAKRSATPEVKERIIQDLRPQAKFNDRFLISVIVIHYLIFIVPILLVYFLKNSLALISTIFAITLSFLVVVTHRLSDLWKTKMGIDILIALLPNLPPEQAVEAVKALYYALGKPSSSRGTITDRVKL